MASDKFWFECNMLGIKNHILELGIAMVPSEISLEPVQHQILPGGNKNKWKLWF